MDIDFTNLRLDTILVLRALTDLAVQNRILMERDFPKIENNLLRIYAITRQYKAPAFATESRPPETGGQTNIVLGLSESQQSPLAPAIMILLNAFAEASGCKVTTKQSSYGVFVARVIGDNAQLADAMNNLARAPK